MSGTAILIAVLYGLFGLYLTSTTSRSLRAVKPGESQCTPSNRFWKVFKSLTGQSMFMFTIFLGMFFSVNANVTLSWTERLGSTVVGAIIMGGTLGICLGGLVGMAAWFSTRHCPSKVMPISLAVLTIAIVLMPYLILAQDARDY